MSFIYVGELESDRGLGLPVLTTAERTAYTPPDEGYKVWDSTLKQEFVWDGAQWVASGSDDQIASEVNITDAAGNFTATEC